MDKEAVLDAAPLMEGGIVDRRQEIKTELVEYIIGKRNFSGNVSTFRVQTAINQDLGIEIVESNIRSAMESLSDRGIVSHVESEEFHIEEKPKNDGYSSEIDAVWIEYKNRLESSDLDKNIDYKIENHQEAFKEVFKQFFNLVRERDGSIEEYTGENPIVDELDSVISDVADDKPLLDSDCFKDTISGYIDEQTASFLEFIGTIYAGVINYDILHREESIDDLDFRDIPEKERKLFLDTNILIGLLCETDELYPLVSSMCNRAQDLGYDLYYIPETAEELNYVVDKAVNTLTGFPGDETPTDLKNQFVRDHGNRDNYDKAKYITEINRWKNSLKEDWDIHKWDAETEPDEADKKLINNWIRKLDRLEDDGKKAAPQIRHDTALVASTISTRDSTERNIVLGPFAISNNDSLLSINGMGKGELWTRGVVLHPQDWLDYLIAFTSADFTDEDREELAEAVISTATKFDDQIELDDYIDTLATRGDLSNKSKEYLEDMIYGTPLENKLIDAIQRGDYQELENQGQELLSELNELLRENIEKEEQLQKASDRVQEEEQLRKRLEKILNDMTAVEVNNIHNISQEASQDVTQDVHVEVTQETRQQLEFLSEQLSDAVDSSIQESKFPEPPSDFSDADRVISWLQKIDNILSTADDLSQKTKKLKPTVTGLLAAFGL